MDDLQRIDISGWLEASVCRKIAIVGKNEDYQRKTVTLICAVEHYNMEGIRMRAFAPLERDPFLLVASNESKVNPETGALVFPIDGVYPAGAVGQYDWLKAAVEAGANPFAIIASAVLEADLLGRFT